MGQPTYYVTPSSGGYTPDGTLPADAIVATQAQAQGGYLNVGGVPTLPAPIAPTLAQLATAAIAGGVTITSTGTPALNGTYAVASGVPFGREDIGTEAQFITTYSEFTNGTQTIEWPLMDGTFVTFPTTAAFLNFAKVAGQFYAACKSVAALGSGELPSATATIP